MCDCYYTKCEICKRRLLPVHISDFCMSRDDVRIYCQKHIPKKDIVIHKLIEDENYSAEDFFSQRKERRKYTECRSGWKMGVRYLKKPPKEYGYTAVTPNVACDFITKRITKSKKIFWTTEWIRKNHNNEIKAIRGTIKRLRPFSPTQQVWRRYLLKLGRISLLRKLDLPADVLKEIKIITGRLKRRYADLLGVILIGSFAEGTYQKDSDIDIVFIKERIMKHRDLAKITKGTKKEIQLIRFNRKNLSRHFKDSTTMAYAIQRGKIIYQKKDSLEKYYNWILEWPNREWMEKWFKHWLGLYSFGVEDFKKNKKRDFNYVNDCLPRGVVNFGILFLESKGCIPTTKRHLRDCFVKEISGEEIKEGFITALKSHHEDRDISLNEAEKVYRTGEFLKEAINKYFEELKKREEKWLRLKR